MAKFVCIVSHDPNVRVGTVLHGKKYHDEDTKLKDRFILTKDSKLLDINNLPRWAKGKSLPINGVIWKWKEHN